MSVFNAYNNWASLRRQLGFVLITFMQVFICSELNLDEYVSTELWIHRTIIVSLVNSTEVDHKGHIDLLDLKLEHAKVNHCEAVSMCLETHLVVRFGGHLARSISSRYSDLQVHGFISL